MCFNTLSANDGDLRQAGFSLIIGRWLHNADAAFWKQSCDHPHENGLYWACQQSLLTSLLVAEFEVVVDILKELWQRSAYLLLLKHCQFSSRLRLWQRIALQAIIQTVMPKETIQNAKTKSSMEPTSCSVCRGRVLWWDSVHMCILHRYWTVLRIIIRQNITIRCLWTPYISVMSFLPKMCCLSCALLQSKHVKWKASIFSVVCWNVAFFAKPYHVQTDGAKYRIAISY